jgi:hypothetical protein
MTISTKFKTVATTALLGLGLTASCDGVLKAKPPVTAVNDAGITLTEYPGDGTHAKIGEQDTLVNKESCTVSIRKSSFYSISYDFKYSALFFTQGAYDNVTKPAVPISSLTTRAAQQEALDLFKALAGTKCEKPVFAIPAL